MSSTAWVLTTEMNEYDQHGEYFVAVWLNKPSSKEVFETLMEIDSKVTPEYVEYVMSIGGRDKEEDQWYYLREVATGKNQYGHDL